MVRIGKIHGSFKRLISDVRQKLAEEVTRYINSHLEAEVEAWLYRGYHERRKGVGRRKSRAQCQRCGTREARHFSRNGHRRRELVTEFGVLKINVPRVICECGGSVRIPFSILLPGQRIWDDVCEQVARWGAMGISLRQMQEELGTRLGTQIGLRKLNEIVQGVKSAARMPLSSVPPIIILDAIWVTLLEPTGRMQRDRLGRERAVKAKKKVCLLVALGVYPQSGRWGILEWRLADSESREAWEALLVSLEARGIYRERGVELFIHDGGSGLRAALKHIHPFVPHQRCLFHKLRNLRAAIATPSDWPPKKAQTLKRQLMEQIRAIFAAPSLQAMTRRRDAFVRQWQAQQPDLVTTLCRAWSETVAFFRVLARFPHWSPRFLRTTSLLERVNRMIRRLFRAAGAFHSSAGLLAAATRVLEPYRLL